jgi:hypothetical protein
LLRSDRARRAENKKPGIADGLLVGGVAACQAASPVQPARSDTSAFLETRIASTAPLCTERNSGFSLN